MAGVLVELTEETFQEGIRQGVVLVDCYADWCGPCRMMGPVLEKVAAEVKDVRIVKLDIDKAQRTAGALQVTSIPTLILFKDGKETGRLVGLRDQKAITDFVRS